MPYRITASGAGGWYAGDVVEDKEFEAHPFHQKFLDRKAAEKISNSEAAPRSSEVQVQVNDLDSQIASLQAKRAELLGEGAEPNAPAAVEYQIDAENPPTKAEREQVAAEGREVVQPGAAHPNVGEVVSVSEEAPKNKGGRPPKVQE